MHLPAEKKNRIARGWELPMAEMNHDQSISIYSNLLQTQMKQLVGGFNHLEKYEFVNGKDYIPHILYYGQFYMFETTNQTGLLPTSLHGRLPASVSQSPMTCRLP